MTKLEPHQEKDMVNVEIDAYLGDVNDDPDEIQTEEQEMTKEDYG